MSSTAPLNTFLGRQRRAVPIRSESLYPQQHWKFWSATRTSPTDVFFPLFVMIKLAGIDRVVTTLNTITREEEKHPIWEVASSHMARRVLVGNLYKEVKDPNLIAKISGHVENSRAFSRYRDIDEEMAKEVILKLE